MKMKVILIIAIVLVLVLVLTLIFHQKQDDNILMELVYWPGGGGGRGSPIYSFIVKDDGTFISLYGLSRSNSDYTRTRNFMILIREREEIALSDEDFLLISELVNKVVSGCSEMWHLTNLFTIFIHDGNIYEKGTARSGALSEMIQVFFELTPISVR